MIVRQRFFRYSRTKNRKYVIIAQKMET